MKVTLSVIKADIGSIGGHIRPSAKLLETVRSKVAELGKGLLIDTYVGFTGDDIAILMSHTGGTGNAKVHKLAWDAFIAGTATAKAQGLYGAGQDLLKDSFSGNVKGMGPAVAEMEIRGAPQRAVRPVRGGQDRPGSVQPALLSRLRRPDVLLRPHPLPEGGEGVHLPHHGRREHGRGQGDRPLGARGSLRHRGAAARPGAVRRRVHPLPRHRGDRGRGQHHASPQHRGEVHREGRPGDARPDAGELSRHGGGARTLHHRPPRRRLHAGKPPRGAHAGAAEHGNLLLRRSADRLGPRLQREGGAVHRAGRRVRPPVLGVRAGDGCRPSPRIFAGRGSSAPRCCRTASWSTAGSWTG